MCGQRGDVQTGIAEEEEVEEVEEEEGTTWKGGERGEHLFTIWLFIRRFYPEVLTVNSDTCCWGTDAYRYTAGTGYHTQNF